jgi:hypothetical protein
VGQGAEHLEQDISTGGGGRRRVREAPPSERPQTEPGRRGYAPGCEGMRGGQAVSILRARGAEGRWPLPWATAVMPVEESPPPCGVRPGGADGAARGGQPEERRAVAAQDPTAPPVKPGPERGVTGRGSVSSQRNFSLPPPP